MNRADNGVIRALAQSRTRGRRGLRLLPPQPISPPSKTTPVLLIHGEDDKTIPPMASRLAAAKLGTAGFKVELDIERGAGHTISSAGAQKALLFLKRALF